MRKEQLAVRPEGVNRTLVKPVISTRGAGDGNRGLLIKLKIIE